MNIKRYAFGRAAQNHIPVSGTFELTPRCNLSCEMCYIRMSAAEETALGAELTAAQWLSLGAQAVKSGMIYLLLTGGEPLLRPDFAEIYTGMAKMGVMLTLNTNGTLVTDETVRILRDNPPERVNISIYGTGEDTYERVCGCRGGYEAAVHGVRLLHEAGIPVCINATFTRHNAADMEKIVSFAKENGVPIRMTSYLFPPLRCGREESTDCFLTPEEHGALAAGFDALTMDGERLARRGELLESLRRGEQRQTAHEGRAASCMAGRGAFWITWNGQLLPCGMLPRLGRTLADTDFDAAWAGLDGVMDAQLLPEKCVGCEKRAICPVCIAVTQSESEAPQELCRFCGSYIEAARGWDVLEKNDAAQYNVKQDKTEK